MKKQEKTKTVLLALVALSFGIASYVSIQNVKIHQQQVLIIEEANRVADEANIIVTKYNELLDYIERESK